MMTWFNLKGHKGMGKKIAFIGSSGGNLYKQGGNNLPAMMKEICGQTTAADMEITFVQYVLASGSLDNVGPDSPATLYTWNGTEVQAVFQGTLTEVNVEAEKVDEKLAKKIDDGEIDGVMFVSASPDGANRQAMEACARTKIPMAGTGGSGVALTQNMGCNVLSASGTTGTTNRTRAVAFTTALAKNSIPIVICATAAKQVSGLDEVGVVAGIVAGILAVDGGILGGLIIGILAGVLAYYISVFCFRHNVPGTTVNIASGGLGGLAAGLVGKFLIAPVALWIGNGICSLINMCIDYNALLAGAVAGLLIWPAIIGGVYHAAILPIVLLEMEEMGFSFLGAIDMTGLVMVSAGITLANIILPKQKGEAAVALPGCIINICFGTFVEASYPFMFSNKIVFAGALASATVGGAIVGLFNVKGTAYVPAVLAPFMANEGKGPAFAVAMIAAMGCAFAITMAANVLERKKSGKIPVKKV